VPPEPLTLKPTLLQPHYCQMWRSIGVTGGNSEGAGRIKSGCDERPTNW
jgi:hypothetical protein